MSIIEDQLRDALRADAETVRPESLRDLHDLHGQAGQHLHAGREAQPGWKRLGLPLSAAAAVAVIAVTASVAVPKALSGHRGSGSLAPSGALPAFFVGIRGTGPADQSDATELDTYSSATGKIIGRLALPGGNFAQAVAALGPSRNRTFVVGATVGDGFTTKTVNECHTWLYRFRLNSLGRPVDRTPLAVPEVAGLLIDLTASADGNAVSYVSGMCDRHHTEDVGLIDLHAGRVTTWSATAQAGAGDLSLSADGSLLALVGSKILPYPEGQAAWVLRASSPPGPLFRRAHKVLSSPQGVHSARLSPTGAAMFAITVARRNPYALIYAIGAYDTANGRLIRRIAVLPEGLIVNGGKTVAADVATISLDSTARFGLVAHLSSGDLAIVNLSTGKISILPVGKVSFPTTSESLASVAW